MNPGKDLEGAIKTLLEAIEADPDRSELKATPSRVAETLLEFTKGYREDISEEIEKGLFDATGKDPVIVRELEFESLCEHHLLPFFGRATVVFIPDKRLIGLSKIGRVLDHFAARLQVQERMTAQVAEFLDKVLNPLGVGVVITAFHTCMNLRGAKKRASIFTTRAIRAKSPEIRNDVAALLDVYGPTSVF